MKATITVTLRQICDQALSNAGVESHLDSAVESALVEEIVRIARSVDGERLPPAVVRQTLRDQARRLAGQVLQ